MNKRAAHCGIVTTTKEGSAGNKFAEKAPVKGLTVSANCQVGRQIGGWSGAGGGSGIITCTTQASAADAEPRAAAGCATLTTGDWGTNASAAEPNSSRVSKCKNLSRHASAAQAAAGRATVASWTGVHLLHFKCFLSETCTQNRLLIV